jgi:hypothetical protein
MAHQTLGRLVLALFAAIALERSADGLADSEVRAA